MKNLRRYYRKIVQNAHDQESISVSRPDPLTQAKSLGYSEQELQSVPDGAVMGMGCGNPVALAKLREGETVLDIGCGGGLDVFLAARRVGEKGHVIGIDKTPEMVERANGYAAKGHYANVKILSGDMESLPIEQNSVDVIISNCVINHAINKVEVFREMLRCLKPGGRMMVSDLVVEGTFEDDVLRDKMWGEWIAHAAGKQKYMDAIKTAGFEKISILSEHLFNLSEADDRLKGKIISISVEAYK